ncbi:XRE family transcriptional regulator [Bacillus cereus]|nr:XRE family transcriptional regulator [Bacillus cereus]MEB8671529.1 XRE family transcriptional regulator [Bacillus cereus]
MDNKLNLDIIPVNDIEKIILFMRRYNLSNVTFANKLGITPNYLSGVINEKYPLNENFIRRFNYIVAKENCIEQ